ncbi:sugar kinase [Paenibacillaceae bacterium WGS1546]|uniref:sugar kinase n=1 Tax=Cohnella sp. WGS1546 TaxID=3366810 RepID=UPI00372CEDDC
MAERIAAFGEVMMRLQTPGYELLSQAGSLNYSFSGTGVNVASALSRLGHDGSLVTRLPEGALGDAAAAYLRKLGISPAFVSRGGSYIGMYFLENGFGPRPSRVTYTNRLESSFNTAPEGTYDFDEIAGRVNVAHFCGISLAMNGAVRGQMTAFAEAVRARGGLVAFDCNYRPSLWGAGGYAAAKPHYERMLKLADIVMMNELDAERTLGLPSDGATREDRLKELIPKVAEAYGISVAAGTHRSVNPDNTHSLRGYLYKGGRFHFSETLTFAVYDRIGAGDAYTSGILHGELRHFAPERAVRFAAAAAMLAHTTAGDTPLANENDVLRAMERAAEDVER